MDFPIGMTLTRTLRYTPPAVQSSHGNACGGIPPTELMPQRAGQQLFASACRPPAISFGPTVLPRNAGGCTFLENAGLDAAGARPVWRASADPHVVTVDALAVSHDHPDAIDIHDIGVAATVLRDSQGGEEILLSHALRQLRLSVRKGSFLAGPVRLHYALQGLETLAPKLLTLQRLLALARHRRFVSGLFPPERCARRWIMMLRTHDALRAGASQREIASVLFGGKVVQRDWRTESDSLRLRVRRLARQAKWLTGGGHLDLLQ